MHLRQVQEYLKSQGEMHKSFTYHLQYLLAQTIELANKITQVLTFTVILVTTGE